MRNNLVRNGFIAAGAMNIGGVLLFSRGFNNDAITQGDPVVMSNFGLLMIAVWNDLVALYAKDLFAGIFFSIYGLNDLVFMLFFAWVFLSPAAVKRETRR